jgi:hypothetical protein
MARRGREAAETGPIEILPRLSRRIDAISWLVQSFDYANDLGVDVWEFGIELDELLKAGMSRCDLRWLLLKGYAEHAAEATSRGSAVRRFTPLSSPNFRERVVFILTDSGREAFRRLPAAAEYAASWLLDLCRENNASPREESLRLARFDAAPPGDMDLEITSIEQRPENQEGNLEPSVVVRLACPRSATPQRIAIPTWDARHRELWFDGRLVKRFRVPAENQELVLAVFEEEGWPARIDDPLAPAHGLDVKARLQSTIKSLNRRQYAPLLRFFGNGCGRSVCWTPVHECPSAG